MTLIIPPGHTAVAQHFTHALTARESIVTYAVDSDLRVDVGAIANECMTIMSNALKALVDNSVFFTTCTVRTGTSTPSEPIAGASSIGQVAGTKSQSSLPPNNALLVTKLTARGGRRGRGRMFFPWVVGSTDPSEAGIIGSTVISAWNTALAAWLTAAQTGNLPLVLLHNEGISEPDDPDNITGLQAQQLISTQRRRLGR